MPLHVGQFVFHQELPSTFSKRSRNVLKLFFLSLSDHQVANTLDILQMIYRQCGLSMIEGLFNLVTTIVEFFVSLFVTGIEFIASFFVSTGETLAAFDVFLVLLVLATELMFWLLLWIKELFFSLMGWRKPKSVLKPIFWRPKPKIKKVKN